MTQDMEDFKDRQGTNSMEYFFSPWENLQINVYWMCFYRFLSHLFYIIYSNQCLIILPVNSSLV